MATTFDHDYAAQVVPMAGAEELLQVLSAAGWRLGLVTNGRDAFQRAKLAGLGWTDRFHVVLTSEGFGEKKPSPAIFRAALAMLGVPPTAAVMIGDDWENDVVPALRLGARAIWKSRDRHAAATLCAESLAEIAGFFRGET